MHLVSISTFLPPVLGPKKSTGGSKKRRQGPKKTSPMWAPITMEFPPPYGARSTKQVHGPKKKRPGPKNMYRSKEGCPGQKKHVSQKWLHLQCRECPSWRVKTIFSCIFSCWGFLGSLSGSSSPLMRQPYHKKRLGSQNLAWKFTQLGDSTGTAKPSESSQSCGVLWIRTCHAHNVFHVQLDCELRALILQNHTPIFVEWIGGICFG